MHECVVLIASVPTLYNMYVNVFLCAFCCVQHHSTEQERGERMQCFWDSLSATSSSWLCHHHCRRSWQIQKDVLEQSGWYDISFFFFKSTEHSFLVLLIPFVAIHHHQYIQCSCTKKLWINTVKLFSLCIYNPCQLVDNSFFQRIHECYAKQFYYCHF